MRRIGNLLATVVAMSVGFLMTLGLLYDGIFTGQLGAVMSTSGAEVVLRGFAAAMPQFITLVAALALIVGLLNLLIVHIAKIVRIRQYGTHAIWSALLVACTLTVIWVSISEATGTLTVPAGEATYSRVLRDTVQYSVEASLAGLLAFSLVYGAFRFARRRFSVTGLIFLLALVLNLLLQAGLRLTAGFSAAVQQIVDAGTTGIIIGVALATLVAGVRVLIGQDRSYRD